MDGEEDKVAVLLFLLNEDVNRVKPILIAGKETLFKENSENTNTSLDPIRTAVASLVAAIWRMVCMVN